MLRSLPSTHTEGIFYLLFFKNTTDKAFLYLWKKSQQCFCSSGPWVYFYLSLFVLSFCSLWPVGNQKFWVWWEAFTGSGQRRTKQPGATPEWEKNRENRRKKQTQRKGRRMLRKDIKMQSSPERDCPSAECVWSGNREDQQKFCVVSDITLRWCFNSCFLFLAGWNYNLFIVFLSLTVIKKVFMAVLMWRFVLKIISTEQISVKIVSVC